MVSRLYSCTLVGIDAHLVQVETDLTPALPSFQTVGLPDTVVKESKERVLSALKNSDCKIPMQRIVVNLAPAELKKEGAALDLAIAMGIILSSKQIEIKNRDITEYILVGELALNGELRGINGVLSIASSLVRNGFKKLILPEMNAKEASMVEGIEIYPVQHLRDVIMYFDEDMEIIPYTKDSEEVLSNINHYSIDYADVKGQDSVKRAIEIAAAGGHNIIMIGSPGSGKTMLARRLPTILPKLSIKEAIESTKIHSAVGMLPNEQPLVFERPFRSPHHTISDAGLIGGGSIPKPGEVSLAHNGVLFLDELPEFRRNVLEVLRQPLEDGVVTISRSSMTLTYPARFILAAALNPCPCGYLTDPNHECTCTPSMIMKYRNKISGPLLDRIDIHIDVPPASFDKISSETNAESSKSIRQRIEKVREVQLNRFETSNGIFFNAYMNSKQINDHCKLDKEGKTLLHNAMEKLNLSARAYHKILKVARTVADLENSEAISTSHLGEAIQYRSLDRNYYQ